MASVLDALFDGGKLVTRRRHGDDSRENNKTKAFPYFSHEQPPIMWSGRQYRQVDQRPHLLSTPFGPMRDETDIGMKLAN
jgi:hypothetical protein